MSLWKDNTAVKPAPTPASLPIPETREPARAETPPKAEMTTNYAPAAAAPRPVPGIPGKESVIASDLTIEGKIEGGGSVRIAGKFKGDVNVQGDLTIEAGAKLTGSVRADKVTIAGELEGNVIGASRIDLLQTGTVIGDLKARSLAVAAGATMRGKAEFGGEDGEGPRVGRNGAGHA
jgi:cytoskeletal protein CcmA (bactofilin family)